MSAHSYVSMKSEFFYEHSVHILISRIHIFRTLYILIQKGCTIRTPFLLTFHFSPHPQLKKQILNDYPDFYGQNVSNDK